jgi:hypothetical protein
LYTRSAIRFIRSSADFVYLIGYPLHPVFCLSNPIRYFCLSNPIGQIF